MRRLVGEPVRDFVQEPVRRDVLAAMDAVAALLVAPEIAIHPVRMRVQVAVRERQVLTAVLVRAAVQADAADALMGADLAVQEVAVADVAARATKLVSETAIRDAQAAKAVRECVKANVRGAVDRHAHLVATDVTVVLETVVAAVLAAAHPA